MSVAVVTAEHVCHEHQETTISSKRTVTNKAFSCDVMVAKLVFQNNVACVDEPNQTCGSLLLFLCKCFLLFQWICIDADHVSKNALYQERPITGTIGIRPDS